MDKIIIEGGFELQGEVSISGAKNAALPIMAATILADGTTRLTNLPALRDINTISALLRHMGAQIETSNGAAEIRADGLDNPDAPYDLVKTMRASALVLGPLLARHGRARVSLPGGCAIGPRPIDLHLKALEAMGAEIVLEHGYVNAEAPHGLRAADFSFDQVTVTGTENIMMAAALTQGRTILRNSAREPEVVDLARALNAMGARISGAGSDAIIIDGVTSLKAVEYQIMPDRIETGTFMVAAGLTRGRITLKNAPVECIGAIRKKLEQAGLTIHIEGRDVRVQGPDRIVSTDVKTEPYPGFPTDMQAQFMALMTVGTGLSVITETIFENRFMHVSELKRMGADIRLEGNTALINAVPHLSGAPVMATDLRASASLVLAGLGATGLTELSRVYHIDRGYEKIEQKLSAVGARIRRIKD
ncbi:MAG: UDP-N-acetylglucosamine 1-carboxyvinyltransferase [Proteobacteria bacterium]|nr:UDP-N-acetylglucosamine 1-carboxyvinyltransferase [Pseudomonadota bacterium]